MSDLDILPPRLSTAERYRWSHAWSCWIPVKERIPLEPLDIGPLEPEQPHATECQCGGCFFARCVPNDELYQKLKASRDWWSGK